MFSSSRCCTVTLALILSLAYEALALPNPSPVPAGAAGQTMALTRRSRPVRTVDEWGVWAKTNRDQLISKYSPGSSSNQKRGSGTNLIVNQDADSTYYGSLAIGTPPLAYDVILDTGSSDLWIAGSNCITGCSTVPTFNPGTSSSFKNLTQSFSISYGSGKAAGLLAQDTIQMAGFTVKSQTFAVCDEVSSGLLQAPVSGLMGLAFQTIATSGATPFWQSLVEGGAWDSPVMTFQLTRFINQKGAQALESGGTFTMGFTNSSLFTGDIDFQNIPAGQESYWILPMTQLTVQGNAVTLPTGSQSFAAIDTGTTLVGGPSSAIAALYAQIPGSAPGTGNYEGYFTYPCSTSVNVSLSFGGNSWPISPADFKLTELTTSQCLGAFFELETGAGGSGGTPAWIVGDTFLKNVYSVFRYNPPSVGFATLSSTALAMSNVDAPVPSATFGSATTQVTANSNGGGRMTGVTMSTAALALSVSVSAGIFSVAL